MRRVLARKQAIKTQTQKAPIYAVKCPDFMLQFLNKISLNSSCFCIDDANKSRGKCPDKHCVKISDKSCVKRCDKFTKRED